MSGGAPEDSGRRARSPRTNVHSGRYTRRPRNSSRRRFVPMNRAVFSPGHKLHSATSSVTRFAKVNGREWSGAFGTVRTEIKKKNK